MKFILLTIFVFATNFIRAQYFQFTYQGKVRTYLAHWPAQISTKEKIPLILALHGGGGNAFTMESISGLSQKADSSHFLVVYPEGTHKDGLAFRTWNAGWCCGYAANNQIDDVGFIDTLIHILKQQFTIDENRIYVTGMSNGGFMAYRIACELSSKIAAIAPVAATMTLSDCEPTRGVSIIHFHSYLDTHVPYYGGIGSGLSHHYNPPLDSVLNAWSFHDSCLVNRDTLTNNEKFTLIRWGHCHCNREILYYITHDGGHSWPGNPDGGSQYLNATDLMWEFFKKHPLLCDSASYINQESFFADKPFVSPNPFHSTFIIKPYDPSQKVSFEIYDLSGRKIIQLPNKPIQTPQIPKGFYLLKVTSGKQRYFIKIVKL